tara:strand:- start:847 stop:1035 length:189 start_codon:yes stop_codon:yes gene_type:complete
MKKIKNNLNYDNWTTSELVKRLYILEHLTWTTKTHYQIHAIKKHLKNRENFLAKLELYKDFF